MLPDSEVQYVNENLVPSSVETQIVSVSQNTLIHSEVQYVNKQFLPISSDNSPQNLILLFPVISGHIIGSPVNKIVYITHVRPDLTFDLDLSTIEHGLQESSATLTSTSFPVTQITQINIQVDPITTKLSRLGTFATLDTGEEVNGSKGFLDKNSRDTLMLIYTDRACKITGSYNFEGIEYEIDIQVSGKGLHWINLKKIDERRYIHHNLDSSSDIAFFIMNGLLENE